MKNSFVIYLLIFFLSVIINPYYLIITDIIEMQNKTIYFDYGGNKWAWELEKPITITQGKKAYVLFYDNWTPFDYDDKIIFFIY